MKQVKMMMVAVTAVALMIPFAAAAGEGAWFDLENCAMCKNMSAEEGLMEHMEWENHLVENGMLSITRVDPAYEDAFKRSMDNMQATGQKLMTGEQMHLCGFCQSYGGLHMSGANFEMIKADAGYIDLVTSGDPKIVAMIHKHGQRTIDEYNAMFGSSCDGKHKHDEKHAHHDKHQHDH